MLFSTALTGKLLRKEAFSEYKWDRCVLGIKDHCALLHGNLWETKSRSNEVLIFAPANFSNVAAHLEAFWGYIWPTACNNYMPLIGEWSVPKHSGLKEFVDHATSIIGRDQTKPSTKCLRGVPTYPKGDMIQGRYAMALSRFGEFLL